MTDTHEVANLDVAEQAELELELIGVQLAEQGASVTATLVDQFEQRIGELPHDPALMDLLEGSTGANLETVAHLLRGRVPIADVHAPAAAVEYSRRLAQRGTPPSALLRAYRLGQQLMLRWANDLIVERMADAHLALATAHRLTELTFRYVDKVSEEVSVSYQEERERWLANRNAVQRETVERLLNGEHVDLSATESVLGYRLRQHHLGLVLWTNGGEKGADLTAVERTAGRIAQAMGAGGHPLFVPRDRETGWAWIPTGRSGEIDLDVIEEVIAESDHRVLVASGRPGAGEPGFRTTHLGAVAAQEVAQLSGYEAKRAIAYQDPTVRAAAMLARDLSATRHMVRTTLGGMAEGTDAAVRMRETLLAFLEERESYVATAARVHLHKNTVKYRVDRAIEARGKPLHEERLDLELALIACKWLAPEVLAPSPG
ncbi:MAG: helix-turn-helix domain-containing protein [Nocardioidaceae bacterium]|nr:helix-turn-helix domain-containing protein [Nocardioidaceae bacterium]